jgi:N-acetylmuramate 1-kinase
MTRVLAAQGVLVPEIMALDEVKGFMLLSDFGDTLLFHVMEPSRAFQWYTQATWMIKKIQQTPLSDATIPSFDSQHTLKELEFFREWCVGRLLGLELSTKQQSCIDAFFHELTNSVMEQPKTLIHRDFHSRNLMVLVTGDLACIDYQDAMLGPYLYDWVSLLRDCYLYWPKPLVQSWLATCFEHLSTDARLSGVDFPTFLRWFDEAGLQRHLKVLGIFSRLKIRDGKQGYLKDMPRVVKYIQEVMVDYPQYREFNDLFNSQIVPSLEAFWSKEGIAQVA